MKGCYLIDFNKIGNKERGYIGVVESNKNIDFDIKRTYYIFNAPINSSREFHVHKESKQVLICLSGSVKVKCTNGSQIEVYELYTQNKGLYVDPMVRYEIFDYKEGTVLMVLASDYYKEDYNEFINHIRKVNEQNKKEYFVHTNAIVDTSKVGKGTRIWGFSHILKSAIIGKNCNICEHCFVENDVILGDNVTIKCGVYIWDGIIIKDNVFVGPGVTFINDIHPRSKQYPESFERIVIEKGASLGANSTIMGGVTIGEYATVGAGSVVLNDVKPYEIIVGNPARVIGYNCVCGLRLKEENKVLKCKCNKKYKIENHRIIPIV